jgi:hypothetical protein
MRRSENNESQLKVMSPFRHGYSWRIFVADIRGGYVLNEVIIDF